MATEVELKFALPSMAVSRILRLPKIAALITGPVRRQKLESVYFDTADYRLRDEKVILRVRTSDDGTVQTIKSACMEDPGGLTRREWEDRITGNRPDFARAKGTALEPLATPRLKRAIREIFRTVMVRTVVPLRLNDALIEMAIDRGHIVSSKGRELIAEMELELKSGDATQLFRLGRRIAGLLPVGYAPWSKAERGYALITGTGAKPAWHRRCRSSPTSRPAPPSSPSACPACAISSPIARPCSAATPKGCIRCGLGSPAALRDLSFPGFSAGCGKPRRQARSQMAHRSTHPGAGPRHIPSGRFDRRRNKRTFPRSVWWIWSGSHQMPQCAFFPGEEADLRGALSAVGAADRILADERKVDFGKGCAGKTEARRTRLILRALRVGRLNEETEQKDGQAGPDGCPPKT